MIIGANKRGNGGQLAAYLLSRDKNERAKLVEMRGFADVDGLNSALNCIELEAAQTKGEKPFYHCWLRLDEGESLTPEQWRTSLERVEQRLKLDEQARVVVEHQLKGERHWHVVWSLVDRERGQMIEVPFDGMRRVEIARQLEQEFDLRRLAPAHQPEKERLRREDWQQAERTQRDAAAVRDVKAAIRAAWERSDTGAAFCAALAEERLMLAMGDSERQPFGVVDGHGQFHALTRTLDVRVKAVRGKLADLDRDPIPTVEQAHALLQEREGREDRQADAANPKDQAAHEPEREEPAAQTPEPTPQPARHAVDRTEAPRVAAEPEPARERTKRAEDTRSANPQGDRFRVFDPANGIESGVSAFAGKTLDYIATQAEGLIEGIAESFGSLFDGGSAARRPPAPEPTRAEKAALERLYERAAKERALRNISKSVQRGQAIGADDLRALPRSELERIHEGGDEYLMRMVKRFERERDDRGRERER